LLDFNLQKHKMQMGVQIVVTDTKQVEEIRQREMDITKEKIQRILDSGARVILTTKVPHSPSPLLSGLSLMVDARESMTYV
jgi:chaperonin GroEL (HSP60 family)